MKYPKFFYGCMAALLIGFCSCANKPRSNSFQSGQETEAASAAGSQKTPQTLANQSVPTQTSPSLTTQAKSSEADKKPPTVIALGDVAEIETLGSFKKLAQKTDADPGYEKARIEYLLERLSRTTYNFLRNGETYDSKKAVLLMRYKWAKFKSEVNTAEDFALNVASVSRTSGEPYYVKAHNRFYLVKDILFFELEQLDQALLRYQAGKAD